MVKESELPYHSVVAKTGEWAATSDSATGGWQLNTPTPELG